MLDTPIVGTEIDQAAAAIEKLWAPGEGKPGADKPQEEAKAPADEAEAQQPEPEGETSEDEPEGEAEDAEGEGEDDAEQQPPKAPDLNALVTVKIDGKEEQIPLAEALAGYQRQSDYSRKTQALAEERRQFIATEVQAVHQERAQYAQLLPTLAQQLQAQQQPVDWDRLRQEDPIEYAIKREEYRERQEKLQAVQFEQQRLAALAQQEQVQEHAQTIEAERAAMLDKMPQWKDEKTWEKTRQSLREYGKKLGFSDEELAGAYDHRAILAMYKAMQFDALQERRAKAQPVQRDAPKGPPPVRAGSSNTPPRQVTEITRAKQRLAKTGSLDDAAALFDRIL